MNIPSIESLLAELDKVKAERDEAINYAKNNELYIVNLTSALREAKKNIETVFYGRWLDEQGPPIHKAITTINKVLGEG